MKIDTLGTEYKLNNCDEGKWLGTDDKDGVHAHHRDTAVKRQGQELLFRNDLAGKLR